MTAVKVLPEPVAIWMRARGSASAKESSRLRMACAWTFQRPRLVERRQVLQSGAKLRRLRQPLGERFRAREVEDLPAARLRVEAVGEVGHGAVGLEQERQRASVCGQVVGRPAAYLADCASTPVSVPSALASTAPTALRSR